MICLVGMSQDYFISFAGSASNSTVDTVKIINLTHPDTLFINSNAGNTTLHLVSWPVGIPNVNKKTDIQVYPTPMVDQTTFKFNCPSDEDVNMTIIDITGKNVYNNSYFLYEGENTFKITGVGKGMYLMKVSGKDFTYSTKLISISPDVYNNINVDPISYVKTNVNKLKNANLSTIEMEYTPGDRFEYKGYENGDISVVIAKTSYSSNSVDSTIKFHFVPCVSVSVDSNGNLIAIQHYSTIHLTYYSKKSVMDTTGVDWMAENLNVGVRILASTGPRNNGYIEKDCYKNKDSLCNIYGGLYEWDEMMQYTLNENNQGICPDGWRIPTQQEWDSLLVYNGGLYGTAGNFMETGTEHWVAPNDTANNSSGFTALGGGHHIGSYNPIYPNGWANFNRQAAFWSSKQYNPTYAISYVIDTDSSTFHDLAPSEKNEAMSVRCIHNN